MTLYEQRLSEDLQEIRIKVQDIADRVCAALENAVAAIAKDDREALYQVVLDDYGINRDIRCIDKRCHEFVARHLPAAGHLRFISAVLRMTIALERAGDYAVTISRVMLQLSNPLSPKIVERVQEMSAISIKMMGDATRAFLAGDAEAAIETKKLDYEVDRAYDEIFSALMEHGADREPQELVSLLKIFSKVERFSDQAKNICEETVFSATGKMKVPKVFNVLFVDERNDLVSLLAEAIARKAYPGEGVYASAGWSPAAEIHPDLNRIAEQFGFDVSRARPSRVRKLDTFPTPYHLVVALNMPQGDALLDLPYHTILRTWDVPIPENLESLVHDLSSRISALMEKLRGKQAD
ncbi:MAG: phosphate signaling complex protein PhoU [Myxococcota bacterium]|nr:phosphate signaling complex protein PhoU [Myxococcota bacterium]